MRTGRPKIELPQGDFEKLCSIWCTLEEIAGFFDCSPDTVERWCKRVYKSTFADVYKQKSVKGNVSIRRKQFEMAQAGNVTLLIWLGKQKLGQSDQPSPPAPEDQTGAVVFETEWGGVSEPETPQQP